LAGFTGLPLIDRGSPWNFAPERAIVGQQAG